MWQKFSERGRRLVFLAQQQSHEVGDWEVKPGHLFLAIFKIEDSLAFQTLLNMGIQTRELHDDITSFVMELPKTTGEFGFLLSQESKQIIDCAYDESRKMQSGYVGTEHILLGLIRSRNNDLQKILEKHGIELEKTRKTVMHLQNSSDLNES